MDSSNPLAPAPACACSDLPAPTTGSGRYTPLVPAEIGGGQAINAVANDLAQQWFGLRVANMYDFAASLDADVLDHFLEEILTAEEEVVLHRMVEDLWAAIEHPETTGLPWEKWKRILYNIEYTINADPGLPYSEPILLAKSADATVWAWTSYEDFVADGEHLVAVVPPERFLAGHTSASGKRYLIDSDGLRVLDAIGNLQAS